MRQVLSLVLAWQLSTVMGCGGSSYATTDLKGMITVSNIPASQGGITFTPLAAHRGRGVFAPVAEGHYEAKGVAVGPARVTFRLTKETGRVQHVYGKTVPEIVDIVPPKYARGVEIDVRVGEGRRDFALDSK